MFFKTARKLRCPKIQTGKKAGKSSAVASATIRLDLICGGELKLHSIREDGDDIELGTLECVKCRTEYPILGGVAILVEPVLEYLCAHAKGISKIVSDNDIPKEYRQDYLASKSEIETHYMEEDLESDRVNSLYLLNHYISSKDFAFWGSDQQKDPIIHDLISRFWDQGPLFEIEKMISKKKKWKIIEQGCGVGGLPRRVSDSIDSYLGVDSAFASIALARHLNFGAKYSSKIQIPGDLIQGPVSVPFPKVETIAIREDQEIDFVVGDLSLMPVQQEIWNLAVSLNAIDMIDKPIDLPLAQATLLSAGGYAVQTGPYIWHHEVAKNLRREFQSSSKDSAKTVQAIYEKAGFQVLETKDHIPWLFFKHFRQIELYSVHLIWAKLV